MHQETAVMMPFQKAVDSKKRKKVKKSYQNEKKNQ